MILDSAILIIALIVIVGSSELFTNGIEWLGQRLQLSEGVVGSVLAAVGTALPETLIPIIAVFFFGTKHGEEVGIGAITGAPFMLSTLTLGICGFSAWIFARRGRRPKELSINKGVIGRDLRFFIIAYMVAMLTSFAPPIPWLRWTLAALLFLLYPLYLFKTFQHEGEVGEAPEALHLDKLLNMGPDKLRLIIPQILLGLGGIIGGAWFFVDHMQDLAEDLKFPALVLSLIITPIATELPEKINSVLWTRTGKDTLALGNVTGALVFQSCFPVAFGVAFTPWVLDSGVLLTGVVAICSATMFLIFIEKGKLNPYMLMVGGVVYIAAVTAMINLDVPAGHH